jgi:hypothetical protein
MSDDPDFRERSHPDGFAAGVRAGRAARALVAAAKTPVRREGGLAHSGGSSALDPSTAPFTREQRQWLTGFLAGVLGRVGSEPIATLPAPGAEHS